MPSLNCDLNENNREDSHKMGKGEGGGCKKYIHIYIYMYVHIVSNRETSMQC